MSSRVAVFTALTMLFSAPTRAQTTNPLIGRWTVEYEVGRVMEDGEARGIRGTGTFTVAQSGDSMLVTIQGPVRPDGTPRPPATIGARATDGTTTFVQKSKATVNMNGTESTHEVVITWSLKAVGDSLSGTLSRTMQDMPEMAAPSAVSGTRVKA